MSLEGKIKKADTGKSTAGKNSADTNVERTFAALQKRVEPYRAEASRPSTAGRINAGVRTPAYLMNYAFDNTVGFGIAKYQDYAAKKYLKKNPKTTKHIRYLMHGSLGNRGSQWKLASQINKSGDIAVHLGALHYLGPKKVADKAFDQINRLQEEVKLEEPYKRRDSLSGHSSGAVVGKYMAGDKRILQYGLTEGVQARGPTPYGIGGRRLTLAQRLILPFAKADDTRTDLGKRNAAELATIKPLVPVHVIAGEYDALVPPADTVYGHAKTHKVIRGPIGTHLAMSGGHRKVNEIYINELAGYSKNKYKYEKAA